jgi:hypothetical protein
MTQLDPSVQIQLIEATLNLLGGTHVRLRGEDHARKFILSFRYVYCGLSAAVAKGESRAEDDVEECFHKLPVPRSTQAARLPTA